jgi:two-component system, sensor histidine kinase and response regulator
MPTQRQSSGMRDSRFANQPGSDGVQGTEDVPSPRPGASGQTFPIVFDRSHALARLGGLDDILQEVFQVMIEETPKMHAAIGAALSRRDAIELKRAAHTLKGSTGILGAFDLTRRLKCVEEHAQAENFDAAAAELDEIDRQFARLTSHLAEELTTV